MANDRTIRQIADTLGISKMVVYRTIQKERIKGHYENDRTLHYTETQERAIKAAITGKLSNTDVTDTVSLLNDRINSQQRQIEELTKLLNQSQQLQLMAEHKLAQLEAPISADESKADNSPSTDGKSPQRPNMAAQEPAEDRVQEKSPRPRWWARLWAKK